MSFSSDIKSEILDKLDTSKKCCTDAETFGEYITTLNNKKDTQKQYESFLEISKLKECCIKNIIKGSFLSSGYITNPESDYHLEILFKNKALAEYYINLLSVLDMSPKLIKRQVGKSYIYVVYILESEQISFYLTIMEASRAVLKFENIRVEKEVKNNINRSINCETANLSKTIKASVIQIAAIEKIKQKNKFNSLSDKLKDAANVRIDNPDSSLENLASMLNITKSGLKHRLDKIIEISEGV